MTNFIEVVREELQAIGVEVEKGLHASRAVITVLNKAFSLIPDPRKTVDENDYPLYLVIATSFLAILSGANTVVEIADFTESKRLYLVRFYPELRHKHNFQNRLSDQGRYTPSHDTYRRIFSLIPMHEFQAVLRDFLKTCIDNVMNTFHLVTELRPHYALDGKVERGTGRKYSAPMEGKVPDIQTLNVYNTLYGMTEYSFPIDEKTNEIPVAQKVIPRLDLNNAVVTADALHTQTQTCLLITNGGGDYVLGVKRNQSGTMETLTDIFNDEGALEKLFDDEFSPKKKGKVRKAHKYYKKESEKAHGQIETREIYVVPVSKLVKPLAESLTEKWAGLTSLVCMEKTITPIDESKEPTKEVRYYISSLADIDDIFCYIRSHWAIEAHHFDMDYTFENDDNQTMNKVGAENLFFLMKVVRTLLLYLKIFFPNSSLKRMRKMMGWDDDNVGYLSILFCGETMDGFEKAYKAAHSKKNMKELEKLYQECCCL